MGRWATRRWAVRALRAAPAWCGHVAPFPQGPKSARHLVPIVGRRGSFVPAARGRQRSARRERGVKITGVNVGGADMVCQARFFLCVHGAHAVAAERPITHKPSTRWLRAAVGLRTYTELSYHTTDYFIQKEERQGAQFKGRSRLVSAVARDFPVGRLVSPVEQIATSGTSCSRGPFCISELNGHADCCILTATQLLTATCGVFRAAAA